MATAEYEAYLKGVWWKNRRSEYIKHRTGIGLLRCDVCGKVKRLEVHHKSYRHLYGEPDIDLSLVCHSCHQAVHLLINSHKATYQSGITVLIGIRSGSDASSKRKRKSGDKPKFKKNVSINKHGGGKKWKHCSARDRRRLFNLTRMAPRSRVELEVDTSQMPDIGDVEIDV